MKKATPFKNVFLSLLIIALLTFLTTPPCSASIEATQDKASDEQQAMEAPDGSDPGMDASDAGLEKSNSDKDKTSEKKEKDSETDEESADKATTMSVTSGGAEASSADSQKTSSISVEKGHAIFTGAARARIPILVPPGRKGIQPDLTLEYNSYVKNGWIGVGWSMDMGAIQRSTRKGLDCAGDDYVFTKSGHYTELVSRENDWGENYYGAKIEEKFTKFYKDPAGGWVATSTDGVSYYFGTATDGHSIQACDGGIFMWRLDKVEDANGNYMEIDYLKVEGQVYLKEIQYTGNDNAPALSPSKKVVFHLQNSREDEILSYESHLPVRTTKTLKSIEIFSKNDQYIEERVGAYELSYEMGSTNKSVLVSVQQFGEDGESTISISPDGSVSGGVPLPANSMQYSGTSHELDFLKDIDSLDLSNLVCLYASCNQSETRKVVVSGNFNNDQKTDILVSEVYYPADSIASSGYVGLSNTDGGFDYLPTELYGGARVIAQGDFNGDGYTDFLARPVDQYGCMVDDNNTNTYLFTCQGDGTFLKTLCPLNKTMDPGGGYGYRTFSQGDYNGDGLSDFIIAHTDATGRIVNETGFKTRIVRWWPRVTITVTLESIMYFSNGDGTFSKQIAYFGNGTMIHAHGDFNGDGKTDFLKAPADDYGRSSFSTSCQIYFGTSEIGLFQIVPYNPGNLPESKVISTQDFNGDGLTDFIIAKISEYGDIKNISTETYKYLSKGNGAFQKILCPFTPPNSPEYWENNVGIHAQGDFNGDGLGDIIFQWGEGWTQYCLCAEDFGSYYMFFSNNSGNFDYHYTNNFAYLAGDQIYLQGWLDATGDFNGDGKTDFWRFPHGNDGIPAFEFPLFSLKQTIINNKPILPDLLTSTSNGRGGTIDLDYSPTSLFPEMQKMHTILPVMAGITQSDGLGGQYKTEFEYKGGVYDYPSQKFRGFAEAKQISPNLSTLKVLFHQDEFKFGKRISDRLFEYNTPNDSALVLEETFYSWYEQPTGDSAKFVNLSQKDFWLYENNQPVIKTREAYEYSDYATDTYLAHGLETKKTTSVISGDTGETVTVEKGYNASP